MARLKLEVTSREYSFDLFFDPEDKFWEAVGYIEKHHKNSNHSMQFSGRATSLKGAESQLLAAIREYLNQKR